MKNIGSKFFIMWFAQFSSLLGTHMTSFALGLSIFEQTQSVFIYSLFPLLTIMPETLLAPLLGVFIDRWNRKTAMIVGHSGSGLCMLAVMIHFSIGLMNIFFILPLIALSSVFNGFIFPAFTATTSQIVPKKELIKTSALLQFGFALVIIIGPALAGAILVSAGIRFIFLTDLLTFIIAVIILSQITIKNVNTNQNNSNTLKAIINEFMESALYIKQVPLLIVTLLIIAIANFNTGIINVLITPLVLGISDNSSVLGYVLSIAGFGLLSGSVILFKFNRIKNRITYLILSVIIQGTVFLLVFFSASIPVITIGAFIFMFCMGLNGGLNTAIWQQTVPLELQGRVFSFKTLIVGSALLLGYLSSGPLTEKFLLPTLHKNLIAIKLMNKLIGKSPYPEIEALLLILGISTISLILAISFFMKFKLKNLTSNTRSNYLKTNSI